MSRVSAKTCCCVSCHTDLWRFTLGNGAQDLELYLEVTKRVHDAAKSTFNCTSLWLTSPTFFSRMDGALGCTRLVALFGGAESTIAYCAGDRKAQTLHDEYWHDHIDKLQYVLVGFAWN